MISSHSVFSGRSIIVDDQQAVKEEREDNNAVAVRR